MKRSTSAFASLLLAFVLVPSPAHALAFPVCAAGKYKNSYGVCVNRPKKAAMAPAGATARCWDGSWSFSQSRRGTCSHHGGVSRWL
jgi:hypothetical protein